MKSGSMKMGTKDSEMDYQVIIDGDTFIFDITFNDTGEIRRKRMTKDQLFKRVFLYERKTWLKRNYLDLTHVRNMMEVKDE